MMSDAADGEHGAVDERPDDDAVVALEHGAEVLRRTASCVGSVKRELDASAGVFAAWSRTKTNGTRKTTTETRIAIEPTIHAAGLARVLRAVTVPPAFG